MNGTRPKTTKRSVVCDRWQVVVVPFPFADRKETKRRPALVLSNRAFNENGSSVMAMITSSVHDPWLGDSDIRDFLTAGLTVPCKVRLKLFTLDNRLIQRTAGELSEPDRISVSTQIATHVFTPGNP